MTDEDNKSLPSGRRKKGKGTGKAAPVEEFLPTTKKHKNHKKTGGGGLKTGWCRSNGEKTTEHEGDEGDTGGKV